MGIAQLGPDDLDWICSRPLKLSSLASMPGLSGPWTDQDAVLLLCADDVIDVLCGGASEVSSENERPRDETEAINALAVLLQEKPHLARADAIDGARNRGSTFVAWVSKSCLAERTNKSRIGS